VLRLARGRTASACARARKSGGGGDGDGGEVRSIPRWRSSMSLCARWSAWTREARAGRVEGALDRIGGSVCTLVCVLAYAECLLALARATLPRDTHDVTRCGRFAASGIRQGARNLKAGHMHCKRRQRTPVSLCRRARRRPHRGTVLPS
jgi:hypothetical protein